ncbi:nodal homolog 2-A-like [Rhinophrynus dorsalis]
MMQLYQNLMTGNYRDLSLLEHPVLQQSDTVLSLIARDCAEVNNHWTLSFDMSSVSKSNELRLAELRIHIPSFEQCHSVTVDIYHSKEGQENLFLGSLRSDCTVLPGSPWKVFNVTEMLQYYVHHNVGFFSDDYTKAMDTTHNGQETNCAEVGADRIMLLVFSKENQAMLSESTSLIKTVESSKYVKTDRVTTRRHKRNMNAPHSIIRSNLLSRPVEDGKHLCRRVDMIVDFEKIGWGNQIIYPKKYNAYRCEGACPVPLNESFKPTNHAYIKSLMNLYDPEVVGCPSCVPVRMSSLSMLMIENGKIVLKHHEDMIVENCGCK